MCGVVGIYSYHRAGPPVDRSELLAISDAMISRGPDGEGEWLSADFKVGLAHRRLSIIDPSDSANQPMVSECGRVVISFNGEIYNYVKLRHD